MIFTTTTDKCRPQISSFIAKCPYFFLRTCYILHLLSLKGCLDIVGDSIFPVTECAAFSEQHPSSIQKLDEKIIDEMIEKMKKEVVEASAAHNEDLQEGDHPENQDHDEAQDRIDLQFEDEEWGEAEAEGNSYGFSGSDEF